MHKRLVVFLVLVGLSMVLVWGVGAQEPDAPALPSQDRDKIAAPGATATASNEKDAADDKPQPTVTPIPFKEIIDRSAKETAEDDKMSYIIQRKDGSYVKILVSEKEMNETKAEDLPATLGLEAEDQIFNIIPSLNWFKGEK